MRKLLRRKKAIIIAFLFLIQLKAIGQCYSSNWQNPSNFSTDNSIGIYDFANPANSQVSDNIRSSAASIISVLSGNTYYLKATGFNFNIPSYAAICGVTVEIECRATGVILTAAVKDNDIRLIKNGALTGSNHALASDWAGSDTYRSYGGNGDLWGTTLVPSDVNSPTFGVAVSGKLIALIAALPSADIDHIRMKVDYNPILPLTLEYFKGERKNNLVSMEWEMAEEEYGATAILQRRTESEPWVTLHEYSFLARSTNTKYKFEDSIKEKFDYQYRLKLTQASGMISYSEVRHFAADDRSQIMAFPNPATDRIMVDLKNVVLIDNWGRILNTRITNYGPGVIISLTGLGPGIYYISNGKEAKAFIKR
jgi:hypothetical protein